MVRNAHLEERMFGRAMVPTSMTGDYKVALRFWEGYDDGRADAPMGSVNLFVNFHEKRSKQK